MLRATLRAAFVRVTGMAACVPRDRGESLGATAIANIVDERPGAVERRGAEKIRLPCHDIARRVAHAAADAFDRGIDRLSRRGVGANAREIVLARRCGLELPPGARPLVGPVVSSDVADSK